MVFPAPLGPINPKNCPGLTAKSRKAITAQLLADGNGQLDGMKQTVTGLKGQLGVLDTDRFGGVPVAPAPTKIIKTPSTKIIKTSSGATTSGWPN